MQKALLFPSYQGGGFGHISRCLALAQELKRRNWVPAFFLSGKYAETVKSFGYRVYGPQFPSRMRSESRENPSYIWITDANFQVPRDGFMNPWRTWAAILEGLYAIRRLQPKVLISDFSLLPWILGRKAGLPVVQISRAIIHPNGSPICWWKDPPAGIRSPQIREVFNPVLERLGCSPIEHAEDLLRGDMYLIPSIPELEPLAEVTNDTQYVGPLINTQTINEEKLRDFNIEDDRRTLYITLGGGAGPVGNLEFFQTLIEALKSTEWRVVVSTGNKFDPDRLAAETRNIEFFSWVPGRKMINAATAVLFHGGYGTMMETVKYGVPSLIIPFHTEQEGNGRRLEHQGAGRVIGPSNSIECYELVKFRWRNGDFSTWVQPRSQLTPEELYESVRVIMERPEFKDRAMALRDIAHEYPGANGAIDTIQSLIEA